MIPLAIDENFNQDIVRGLLRRQPALDLLRVQDAGLSGADDPTVLEWAASLGRVLISHDVATMTRHAYDRVAANQPMPGLFEVAPSVSFSQAIEDLLLL